MTQFPNRSAIYLRIDLALSVPHFFLHFQIPVYTSIYVFPYCFLIKCCHICPLSQNILIFYYGKDRKGKLKDSVTQFLTSVQFSLKGWSEIFTSLFILQFQIPVTGTSYSTVYFRTVRIQRPSGSGSTFGLRIWFLPYKYLSKPSFFKQISKNRV